MLLMRNVTGKSYHRPPSGPLTPPDAAAVVDVGKLVAKTGYRGKGIRQLAQDSAERRTDPAEGARAQTDDRPTRAEASERRAVRCAR